MKRNRRCSRKIDVVMVSIPALLCPLLGAPSLVQAKAKKVPATAPSKVVESSAAPAVASAPVSVVIKGKTHFIPDGTHVKLQVAQTISSNKSKTNEEVHYAVEEDVLDADKVVVIAKGAPAIGVVTRAKGAGGLGRAGKLEFTCDSVTAVNGSTVSLRGEEARSGKSGKSSMVAVTLLLSPLGLFMKGKNITVKQGTVITAYVDSTPDAPEVAATPVR